MDFRFKEDQEMVRRMVREFATNEILPKIIAYDEKQEFPQEIVKRLGELGVMGVIFPKEYGGTGMGYVEYVAIIEELSRVDGSIGLTVAAHNSLCSNHIFISGNEEQKKKYLTPLASGEKIGAWGLTEPTAGSDAGGTKTTAVRDGNSWVLNGTKTFITNATVADIAVVIAVTDKSKGKKGISSFILEKGMDGFKTGKKENKLGMRSSDTAELIMEDCHIPAENLLGEEGMGFVDSLRVLDGGRISIAALANGLALGAFEASLKYSKERQQFGEPISNFQAIQWMLADMATKIEAARLLTYMAADMKDRGEDINKQSAMAKLYAGDTCVWVAERAIQIFGGYGFVKDYPVEKIYRDVKLCTIGEGTSEIQRIVIARQLLK
ncbi:MAG: acyl-CoA dehydrogenase [Acidobacteriota bacterium]